MEIRSDIISISQTGMTKNFPFQLGELVHGKILEKLSDGFYLIQVGNFKLKAQYNKELAGEQLFKVLDNQSKLLLQLISSKGSTSSHEVLIKQFPLLQQYQHDVILNGLLDFYIKYNLHINEKEILFLYHYFKQNKKKWHPGLLNNLFNIKSKGFPITKEKLDYFFTLDEWIEQLEYELSNTLKQKNALSKKLLNQYFFPTDTVSLKRSLQVFFSKPLLNFQEFSKQLVMQNKENNHNFLIEMLKFLAKNQDNKLTSKLVRQLLIERESFLKNDAEEDHYFFTIPLVFNNDEAVLFKTKVFPKPKKKDCYYFIFDLKLSSLGQIRGYCQLNKDVLDLHLISTKEDSAHFLRKNCEELFQLIQEHPLKLGSYQIDYQNELEPFISTVMAK